MLKTEAYEEVGDLTMDVELIMKNPKAFHKPESPEYQDPCQLMNAFNANNHKLTEGMK